MDASSLIVGFIGGIIASAIVAFIGFRASIRERDPGEWRKYVQRTTRPLNRGPRPADIFYSPADQVALQELERQRLANAYSVWKAAQQQEASNERSKEAVGSLGNVPSNVVSKEG